MVEEKKEEKKKISWQVLLILILVLIVIVETAVFSAALKKANQEIKRIQTDNQQMVQSIVKANEKVDALETEKSRCSVILSKPQGEFGEYEYCKKLLQKFPL